MDLPYHIQKKRLQRDLLAPQLATLTRLDVSFYLFPADRASGDFYDLRPRPGGLALLTGDVSGKGIMSSITAAYARFYFQLAVQRHSTAGAMMRDINQSLYQSIDKSAFVAGALLLLPENGRKLEYVVCGMPTLLYRSREKRFVPLPNPGPRLVLGAGPQVAYVSRHLRLETGDILLVHSDGLEEARNAAGHSYGQGRLRRIVRRFAAKGADFIVDHILRDLNRFLAQAPITDDMMLFVLRAAKPDFRSVFMTSRYLQDVIQWRMLVVIFLQTKAAKADWLPLLAAHQAKLEDFYSQTYLVSLGSEEIYEDIIRRGLLLALALRERLRHKDPGYKLGISIQRVPMDRRGELDWSAAINPLSEAIQHASMSPGDIYVTPQVYMLSSDMFRYQPSAPNGMKYRLLGLAEQETRQKLLGRNREYRALLAALKQQAVGVTGAAGYGKTPLLLAVKHTLVDKGYRVLLSSATQATRNIPYSLWLDPLRSLMFIDGGGNVPFKKRLQQLRFTHVSKAKYVAVLDYLFGGRQSKTRAAAVPAADEVTEVISGILTHFSRRRPLCLVFEDIQWADDLSFHLLDQLLLSAARPRILISYKHVSAPRKRRMALWQDKGIFRELVLQPVSLQDVRDYAHHIFADTGLSLERISTLAGEIHAITQGNHLFITEMLAYMHSLYAREHDDAILENISAHIPNNVRAIIEAKLLNLPAEQLKLLQIASIFGAIFPRAFLQQAAGAQFSRTGMNQVLHELRKQHIILPYSSPEHLMFYSPMYREIIYTGLLEEDRLRLHLEAATFCRQRAQASTTGPAIRWLIRLSHHLDKANFARDSVKAGVEIVRLFRRKRAYKQARFFLQRAEKKLARLEDPGPLAFDLLYESCYIGMYFGREQALARKLTRLKTLARQYDRLSAGIKLHQLSADYHMHRGEYYKALLHIRACMRQGATDTELLMQLAGVYNRLAAYNEAEGILTRLIRTSASAEERVHLLYARCDSLLFTGRFRETVIQARRLQRLAYKQENRNAYNMALYYLCRSFVEIGTVSLFKKYMRQRTALAKHSPDYTDTAWNYHLLYLYFLLQGRFSTAYRLNRRINDLFARHNNLYGQAIVSYNLCRLLGQIGDSNGAAKYFSAGLRQAKRVKAFGLVMSNLVAGAELYMHPPQTSPPVPFGEAIKTLYWVTASYYHRYYLLLCRARYYRQKGPAGRPKALTYLSRLGDCADYLESRLYRFIAQGERLLLLQLMGDRQEALALLAGMREADWRRFMFYPGAEFYLAAAHAISRHAAGTAKPAFDAAYRRVIASRMEETRTLGKSRMYADYLHQQCERLRLPPPPGAP